MEKTKELAEAVLEMLEENMKLQVKINKAIEYIKDTIFNYNTEDVKELLEILGDKENEQ